MIMNSTSPQNASSAVEGGLRTRLAVTKVESDAPHPRRGRMTVVTWIGIFPLVYVYERLASWIMPPGTPILLRIAVITALVVPTMSYVVGPQLTRLFKKWLYPGPSQSVSNGRPDHSGGRPTEE
jgi:antibiotic biosynthesis monooxygenase (ABM) superfamily enzyme